MTWSWTESNSKGRGTCFSQHIKLNMDDAYIDPSLCNKQPSMKSRNCCCCPFFFLFLTCCCWDGSPEKRGIRKKKKNIGCRLKRRCEADEHDDYDDAGGYCCCWSADVHRWIMVLLGGHFGQLQFWASDHCYGPRTRMMCGSRKSVGRRIVSFSRTQYPTSISMNFI